MTRAWKSDLENVQMVVRAWSDASRIPHDVKTDSASEYRHGFDAFSMGGFDEDLRRFIRMDKKAQADWTQVGGFLHARPIEVGSPILFPLVSFVVRVTGAHAELMIRIASFFLDLTEEEEKYGGLDAHAWRFETPDAPGSDAGDGTGDSFHHFPHAQPIMAWVKDGPGLFPPKREGPFGKEDARLTAQKWNENRPAFPLPCSSPAGVVISAMAALYGNKKTIDILAPMSRDNDMTNEINAVLRHSPF